MIETNIRIYDIAGLPVYEHVWDGHKVYVFRGQNYLSLDAAELAVRKYLNIQPYSRIKVKLRTTEQRQE